MLRRTIFRGATATAAAGAAALPQIAQAEAAASAPPVSALGWTNLFAAKNDLEWSGGDQATSLRLPDGRTLWAFGDTILGQQDPATGAYAPGWRMVSNTLLVQRSGDATLRRATSTEQAVPNPSSSDRYWPQAMWEHNGQLFVLCQRVRTSSGVLGFELVGSELATFAITTSRVSFTRMWVIPGTGVAGNAGPQWCGAVVKRSGYVYVYGYRNVDWQQTGVPHATYLARVPVGSVTSVGAWRFWNGAGFGSAQSQVVSVADGQVTSAAYLGTRWVLLHKPWNGWGTDVIALSGTAPQGPFGSRVIMSSPEAVTSDGRSYQTYCPQLHPEWPLSGTESGKTLVSICWNGKDLFADTARDADLYKPRFHAIALP